MYEQMSWHSICVGLFVVVCDIIVIHVNDKLLELLNVREQCDQVMMKSNSLPEIDKWKRNGGEEALNDANLEIECIDNHDFKGASFTNVSQIPLTSHDFVLQAETNHLSYFGVADFFGLILDLLSLLFTVGQIKETRFDAYLGDFTVIKSFHPCSDLHF